ncbi:hypothetical protein LINPERHAP1_LOCUS38119 [Linum perenne]
MFMLLNMKALSLVCDFFLILFYLLVIVLDYSIGDMLYVMDATG